MPLWRKGNSWQHPSLDIGGEELPEEKQHKERKNQSGVSDKSISYVELSSRRCEPKGTTTLDINTPHINGVIIPIVTVLSQKLEPTPLAYL